MVTQAPTGRPTTAQGSVQLGLAGPSRERVRKQGIPFPHGQDAPSLPRPTRPPGRPAPASGRPAAPRLALAGEVSPHGRRRQRVGGDKSFICSRYAAACRRFCRPDYPKLLASNDLSGANFPSLGARDGFLVRSAILQRRRMPFRACSAIFQRRRLASRRRLVVSLARWVTKRARSATKRGQKMADRGRLKAVRARSAAL